jgi:hypothetical protein
MHSPFVGDHQLTALTASTVSRAACTSFGSSPSEIASPGWIPLRVAAAIALRTTNQTHCG